MPAFHYVALNQEQKELSGIIEAPDETAARKKLSELKVSVISLNETEAPSAEPAAAGKQVFEFEAVDKQGKKIVGTIVSDDPGKAYARLTDEYLLGVTGIKGQEMEKLHSAYEKLSVVKKKKIEEEANRMADAEQEASSKKDLLQKIDITMARIESFLKDFGAEVKPDERTVIQSYLDQLVRIKDSSNLEHIRATCEKMLEHIQKQTLFIHEEQKLKESSKLKVETGEMLESLKQTGLAKEIHLMDVIRSWQSKAVLKPIADILVKLFPPASPEITQLRAEIKMLNRHSLAYLKMAILGKTKVIRAEGWESIKTIREEKKRLSLKLETLVKEEKMKRLLETGESHFWENVGGTFGWILAFYIISYVISYPLTTKQFSLPAPPENFYFYQSGLTKLVTIFLFLSYGAIAIRNFWLKKHAGAIYLLYPLSIFGFLLIVINLM